MTSHQVAPQFSYVGRLAHIAGVLFRFYPLRWLGVLARKIPVIGRRRRRIPTPAERFRMLLEALGGSFIKFGQVLSLQPDLVPPDYCDELFDLLDRMPPFEFEAVERIFLQDLGKTPDELFDFFETRPFASASIGQVHRATLDGRQLAVKVRRPTALRDFGGDIRLMKAAVWLISKLRLENLEAYRMPISEFIAWTTDELDYRTEARYMAQIGRNTRDRQGARVPAVVSEISTSRILTTELLEGTTLLEYLRSVERADPAVAYRLSKVGFQPEVFAENVIRNFIGDVFRHGLFHADLHPANLLILADNVVGYVDFGITGVISRHGRRHVLALILALSRRDIDEFFQELLQISEVTDGSDLVRYRQRLHDLADDWFELRHGAQRLKKSYTLIMLDMIRLARECQVLPHEEALRYMRSVITADGLITRFAPGYDISEALERLTKRHLRTLALETSFSADRMIEASIAGANLLRDGSSRLDRLLDRLERDLSSRTADRSASESSSRASLATRAARLGLIVVVFTLVTIFGNVPARFGFNLFSAELAVVAAATTLLGWTALRWISSR